MKIYKQVSSIQEDIEEIRRKLQDLQDSGSFNFYLNNYKYSRENSCYAQQVIYKGKFSFCVFMIYIDIHKLICKKNKWLNSDNLVIVIQKYNNTYYAYHKAIKGMVLALYEISNLWSWLV